MKEFASRHSIRELETLVQMSIIASALADRRLRYGDLIRGVDNRWN